MAEKVTIEVEGPKALAGTTLTGERIPIGAPGDYKPCVAKLREGELALTAFVPGAFQAGPGYKTREDILLFRSEDAGLTWTGPENLTVDKGLRGREPYVTVLSDGTLLVTVHFLSIDVRNKDDFTKSYVHRSEDRGKTWTSTLVQDEHLAPGTFVWTTRNILELPDGSLMMGVASNGQENNYVRRSYDNGRTWPQTYRAEFRGLSPSYSQPIFNEGVWWQAQSGKIYLIQRLDISGAEQFFGEDARKYLAKGDYCSCLIQWETTDGGHTFESARAIGRIGEMYPSFLRLDNGTLVTSYSWRDAQHITHMEVIRWRLPQVASPARKPV